MARTQTRIDDLHDAINAFDRTHQRARGIVAELRRAGHPGGEDLDEILDELLEHEAVIVETAIDVPKS